MKKYIVRDGFVVTTQVRANDGKVFDKTSVSGETIELEDDAAAQHLHKLELADAKDRAAALKAEKERKASTLAATDSTALIQQLVGALAAAQKPAQTPPAE
ncbi:hypothetical protein SAMN05216428_112106 [Nitrosospira sp. Nsp11]|uniref:hypothetical protein n=1 Tax=Nitrosospira sp. Nsp11 TaxID=1855338 RepID=UPI00091DE627|nr:hypothetical protein [Nitrosospira sp. Nsp11]SHM05960.1 hypothetical protein SAMN05216428_112106 [Nitrosospira sp. Nsp11]